MKPLCGSILSHVLKNVSVQMTMLFAGFLGPIAFTISFKIPKNVKNMNDIFLKSEELTNEDCCLDNDFP